MLENVIACRARGKALRGSIDLTHSPGTLAKTEGAAQQWDDLADEYDTYILKRVA